MTNCVRVGNRVLTCNCCYVGRFYVFRIYAVHKKHSLPTQWRKAHCASHVFKDPLVARHTYSPQNYIFYSILLE